jgi:hypothetical protein
MGGSSSGLTAVCRVGILVSLLCLSAAPTAFTTQVPPSTGARRSNIPYVAARSIVDALPPDRLPADLRSKTPAERESAWPDWVAGRDRDIRARLAMGDEDLVFNLTLFGTAFTDQRPLTERDIADTADGRAMPDIVGLRIRDLMRGLASPGTNETLAVLMANALVAVGSVHRVAIVGPSLDFADKRQGYDFYSVQTIQPFAVIDSLIWPSLRHGLRQGGQAIDRNPPATEGRNAC